jgi:hypothetical protein
MPLLRSQAKSRIRCLQFTGRQYGRLARMLGLVGDESDGSE